MYGQNSSCEEAGSSRGAPMRSTGIEAPRPTEPRRGEGNPAPATRKPKARPCAGLFLCLRTSHRVSGLPPKAVKWVGKCRQVNTSTQAFCTPNSHFVEYAQFTNHDAMTLWKKLYLLNTGVFLSVTILFHLPFLVSGFFSKSTD